MDDSDWESSFGSPVPVQRKKRVQNAAPLNDSTNVSFDSPSPVKPKARKGGKTIEEEYQKMDQRQHALKRPDMYIGSVQQITEKHWVYENDSLVHRDITFAPGLYKIFDEVLVNAADNAQRDSSQTTIKVEINQEDGTISVYNNGAGIPVVMHQKHKKYVPEMIFGELLTGSSFNDDDQKVTGGRNGLGAKLCNIYSKKFIVETSSSEYGKQFYQEYTENMLHKTKPKITKATKRSPDWTKITFTPDLARFEMTEFEDDILALFKKRVYDVAGTNSHLKVYLNGTLIKVNSFETYAKMYLAGMMSDEPRKFASYVMTDSKGLKRWEIVVTTTDGDFQSVSYVNSICTMRGGTHVNNVADKIVKHFQPIVMKKNKGAKIKPFFIKNNLFIFVNCLINNPEFDSQTKETLKSKVSNFGSRLSLDDAFFKKLAKTGLIEQVLKYANFKGKMKMMRAGGTKKKRITGIAKLIDANEAGGRNSSKCTLILTEGDSAKALAVAGMSVVGRDHYGVFPLRGKLLNVRDAKSSMILKNEEIKSIIQIMGLKPHQKYPDTKGLRYGSICIMADQDTDGSHIKGLLINFVHHFWPSLLKFPGFLTEFITPIVKVTKGQKTISFFSEPEYASWSDQVADKQKWKIKYYKGLGTSTSEEAHEYFSDLARHKKDFAYTGPEDDKAIVMAFGKASGNSSAADKRKDWIQSYVPGTFLDQDTKKIKFTDFIDKELVLFSIANCQRAIPSIVDGLKPGQRKILFSCFKRNLISEIKVAQLSGYVSEKAAYHHGEASLQSTIVNMAQNFVGSNNINLLHPQGQFGTRMEGGKDAASARYITTYLNPLTRLLFHPADDAILKYLDDDGLQVEPEWYMPILPLVLCNGNKGIGTGWSSNIPNYNPREIAMNLKKMLRGEEIEQMVPWYRGFIGTFTWEAKKNRYLVNGVWNRVSDTVLEIRELPVGKWTGQYKEHLEKMMDSNEKVSKLKDASVDSPPLVSEYKDYNTEGKVHFEITVPKLGSMTDKEVVKAFQLESSVTIGNMHFFDARGTIRKYETIEEIIYSFYHLRLGYYEKRKVHLASVLEADWLKFKNQARFIKEVIAEEFIISGRPKSELLEDLSSRGYLRIPPKKKESEEDDEEEESARDYDYLLGMKLWSLTAERVLKLEQKLAEKRTELDELLALSSAEMWDHDLSTFLLNWTKFEDMMTELDSVRPRAKKGGRGKNTAKKPKTKLKIELIDFVKDPALGASSKLISQGATPIKRERVDDEDDMHQEREKVRRTSTVESPTTSPETSPEGKKAPVPRKKAAPVRKKVSSRVVAQAESPVKKKMEIDLAMSDEESSEELNLFARIAKNRKATKASRDVVLSISDSDDELSEDSNSLSVEDAMNLTPKPKKRVAPRGLPVDDIYSFTPSPSRSKKLSKKNIAKLDLLMSSESDSELEEVPVKKAPAKKAAVKKAVPAKKAPAKKKPAPKAKAGATKKTGRTSWADLLDSSSEESSASEEDFAESEEDSPVKKTAPKRKVAAKKPPTKAPAKSRAKPAQKKKSIVSISSEESSDESEDEVEDEDVVATPPPRRRPTRAAARTTRKKVQYADISSSEDEASSFSLAASDSESEFSG